MADSKVSALSAITPAREDVAYLVDDPTGTPASAKATLDDILTVAVAINAQTGTGYTLALTDAGDIVTMDNAGANTLTIPANASVAFPVGTVVVALQKGAGATSITGASGVTVNGVSAGSGDMSAQFGSATLLKVATDTWIASGAIGAVA